MTFIQNYQNFFSKINEKNLNNIEKRMKSKTLELKFLIINVMFQNVKTLKKP